MRLSLPLLLGLVLALLLPQLAELPLDVFSLEGAPVHTKAAGLPNKYIVVFKPHSEVDVLLFGGALENEHHFFSVHDLKGLTCYLNDAMLAVVRQLPFVEFVEQDAVVHVNDVAAQPDAPWGLARLSQRSKPALLYLYDSDGGLGVTAYVIDTGIKTAHADFEGRASWGAAIAFPQLPVDAHGHGSHVAGTIGSKTYGVAKKAQLVAVGVMSPLGTGSTSDIIKGLEFVVNDHRGNVGKKKGYKGATVNMSIGGGESDALDLAVNAAVAAGLHVAVAAGNEDQDACSSSPARASGPITVGAVDVNNAKALFSNWGRCVDILAPGVDILSVGIWSDTATMSGTSMALPHVAGLLTYFLSLAPGQDLEFATALVKPDEMKKRLIKYGTRGVIAGLDAATPNVLGYNGAGSRDFWA